jgi:cell division septum initiation protein DivIVA
MAPEVTPESIRDAQFRTVIRGVDASAVAQFQAEVAQKVAELLEQNERLTTRLGEFADRDLKSEFEVVGNEVTAVLEAAREAAESMRERASLDAARWRSEATAEAENVQKEARNDAEALRGDAWTEGTEMLNQAITESSRLMKQAERDAITITGEAERDAHRMVSTSRREAEDLVRSATMDADKLTTDAAKAHDDMIDQARRQAEASQERTRALEQRREELMAELEGVRTTLSHLEGTLEAKREDLNLSRTMGDSSVRVVPSTPAAEPSAPPESPVDWVPGETVRVVRGDEPAGDPARQTRPALDPPAPAVRVIPAQPPPAAESETDIDEEPVEPVVTVASQPDDESDERVAETTPSDEVDVLFASLRDPGSPAPVVRLEPAATQPESGSIDSADPVSVEETTSSGPVRVADDLLEERDAMLLPITNRSLRGIKKAITEAQNIALDGLRTSADWKPSKTQLTNTLQADLIALWSESFSAGHDMAEAMAGKKLKRPPTPDGDSTKEFVAGLVDSLKSELSSAGDGQRERQSAASKVFRGWRTDEAERRIRQTSLRAFHSGLAGSATDHELEWVASGTPCSACQASAADPANHLPPVHPGCECSIAIATS